MPSAQLGQEAKLHCRLQRMSWRHSKPAALSCSLVAVVVAVFSQLCCSFFAMSCSIFVKCRPGILNHSFFAGVFTFPAPPTKKMHSLQKNGNLYKKNGGAYFGICVADFRIRGCALYRQQLHICTGCFARTLGHVAWAPCCPWSCQH